MKIDEDAAAPAARIFYFRRYNEKRDWSGRKEGFGFLVQIRLAEPIIQ